MTDAERVQEVANEIEIFAETTSACPVYVLRFGCTQCYDTGKVRKNIGRLAGVLIYQYIACKKCQA